MDIDMEKRRSELIEWFEAALRTPSTKLTQYFDESGMYGISLSLKPDVYFSVSGAQTKCEPLPPPVTITAGGVYKKVSGGGFVRVYEEPQEANRDEVK